jgi:hypothetical protein
MKKFIPLLAAVGASAIALATTGANATTMLRLSFESLVHEADVVVVGEVAESRVEQTANGVETVTTFNVSEAVLGAPGATVEVRTPGGSFKPGKFRVSEQSAGVPKYVAGSKAMLFLDAASAGYTIVGVTQGSVIVFDSAQGPSVRLPDSDRVETVAQATKRVRDEKNRPGPRQENGDTDQ